MALLASRENMNVALGVALFAMLVIALLYRKSAIDQKTRGDELDEALACIHEHLSLKDERPHAVRPVIIQCDCEEDVIASVTPLEFILAVLIVAGLGMVLGLTIAN